MKYIFEMLENEHWYGGCNADGIHFPFNQKSDFFRKMNPDNSGNQTNPIYLSNKGRAIWIDGEYEIGFKQGNIVIQAYSSEPILSRFGKTLKEAFLYASKNYFPTNEKILPEIFFEKPQYNTWIELMFNQNQNDILDYARTIIKNHMPSGLLMIDDGWSDYYGKWDFNIERFSNAKAMVDEIHRLGFKVMLWICPFVTSDTPKFREAEKLNILIKNQDGEVAIRKWWNGYSAVLDMTNPQACQWLKSQMDYLMEVYGIDGFKFDAGDPNFYSINDVTYKSVTPYEQCEAWTKFGLNFEYNEYRATYKCAGLNLAQRLSDKNHSWGNDGLSSLISNQLAQGIMGYAYTCPDMIGGGEYSNFLENADNLDEELFVRYVQTSALMPMMQFSAAPWRVLDKYNFEICKNNANLHSDYSKIILELAKNAAKTGEPIVRYMEYVFPNQNMENITDQFMLGDKILVAPVLEKGLKVRKVVLPIGKWEDGQGNKFVGGETILINIDLKSVPIFELK